ncbi:M23 family metallopeptidase [bacterium]|nr:M23 family metallopeptidase [bacterium]
MKIRIAVFCLFILFLQCSKEKVPKSYRPNHAHALYQQSLEAAGLNETALGRDWIKAAKNSLKQPVEISLPHEEIFYIDSTDVFSVGYKFHGKQGRHIEIDLTLECDQHPRVFMDLFRIPVDSTRQARRTASANKDETHIEFEPRRNNMYVIRIQTELLRGGFCRIVIREKPSLAFPVTGKDSTSILSFFGDPRDGGRREHHGVDVFASRHTPVIAPSNGIIHRVGETDIGGTIVWLWDSRHALYLYFAHLQDYRVKERDRVVKGQILGAVGNSGNARTTPPHLHFGIYVPGKGPVDPWLYITQTDTLPAALSADKELIGKWVRLKGRRNNLPMKVLAAAGNQYRIKNNDGSWEYMRANNVALSEKPVYSQTLSVAATL